MNLAQEGGSWRAGKSHPAAGRVRAGAHLALADAISCCLGATWSPGSRWAGSRSEAGAGQKGFQAVVSPGRRQLGNLPQQPSPFARHAFLQGLSPCLRWSRGEGRAGSAAGPCSAPSLSQSCSSNLWVPAALAAGLGSVQGPGGTWGSSTCRQIWA